MNAIRIWLAGLLLSAMALPTLLPAANLDEALITKATALLKALDAVKAKSVAVLPFRIVRGSRAASYDNSPLAVGLATRLENVLILKQASDKKAILVLRNAGSTVSRHKADAWMKDRAAFEKLFTLSYDPAWGEKKSRADVFLTGEVISTGDRKTTTLHVELLMRDSFSGDQLTPWTTLTFSVNTDRSLLRDLGYNIASRGMMIKKGANLRAAQLDKEAILEIGEEDGDDKPLQKKDDKPLQKKDDKPLQKKDDKPLQKKGDKPQPNPAVVGSHTPDNVAGLAIEIFYDGKKQEVRALTQGQGAKHPIYQVVAPKVGQRMAIYLRRVTSQGPTLGAVLKVNGKSVYEEQDQEPGLCNKWIYPAWKKDREDFHGFYSKDEKGALTVKRFRVIPAEEEPQKVGEMGPRAGWIDLDVFAAQDKGAPTDPELTITVRSVGRKRAATLLEARAELARANRLKVKDSLGGARSAKGYVEAGEVEPAGTVQKGSLPNPIRVGGISIRYVESRTIDDPGEDK